MNRMHFITKSIFLFQMIAVLII